MTDNLRIWRTDVYPPAGQVVEVWFLTRIVRAVWTGYGHRWNTPDGEYLTYGLISHWREIGE